MLKYTKHNLKKLETLFEEMDYVIRYEKGNFQSGYCIVENRNIIVINKFYETQGRINCLLEIAAQVEIAEERLSDKSAELYRQIIQWNQNKEEESSKSN